MRLPSPVQHQFSQVPSAELPRSTFNRSHGLKTTFDSGYLVPIFVDEVLPGDTFALNLTAFARLATPVKPVMDNLYLDTFFFYVPLRIIWDNFVKAQGQRTNPDDSIDFLVPRMTAPAVTGHEIGSLSDYLTIPTGVPGLKHSSLWHRGYNAIFNEWFRDENLIDSAVVDKDDGEDNPTDYVLRRRCKRHDYFTSCLPWPQKGDDILLPLGTEAPVYGDGSSVWLHNPSGNEAELRGVSGTAAVNVTSSWGATETLRFGKTVGNTNTGLIANLSSATAATINALREAFQLQRLLERDARGGTRYKEILKAHFGVDCPDYRLQRPEYLGGGSTPITISPVAQNSASEAAGTKQGNLAGFGTVSSRAGFYKSFTEHGIIIGLANVRADLTYQQGLNRMFSRRTRYDFYMPVLANLGEQTVLNKEIYAKADANDDLVFGYQERWAEYRYKPSCITGKFRSTASDSIDVWHLAQEFGALPELGQAFIEENPPLQRVLAVQSPEPEIIYDSYVDLKCTRCMPTYSVPGMIDHF